MNDKFALIGKNISHSLSPRVLSHLLKRRVQYDLLSMESFPSEGELKDLLKSYKFINVTSPYKKNAYHICEHVETSISTPSVNVLFLHENLIFGLNTDYFSMLYYLGQYTFDKSPVSILGDGLMSKLAQDILDSQKRSYRVFSRRLKNLHLIYEHNHSAILNCLSREVKIDFSKLKEMGCQKIVDINYKNEKKLYCIDQDGLRFLIIQAYMALKKIKI